MGFDTNDVSKERLADINRHIDEQKQKNDEQYKQVTQERIESLKSELEEQKDIEYSEENAKWLHDTIGSFCCEE